MGNSSRMCGCRVGWVVGLVLLTVLLASLILQTVSAQVKFPREETMFVTGAQWGPPSTWNPLSPSQTWGTASYGGFLYLPLFQYVPGLDTWIPVIGERFEFPNNHTLRVYIRPEAKWSDGSPITAYDVEFTFKTSLELGSGPAAGSQIYVSGVKAVSDGVVEFYINNATNNYFMFLFYTLQLTPVPKHVFEDAYKQLESNIISWRNCGDTCSDTYTAPQVVSGPYKLYYFDELRVAYVRVDDWWGKDIFGVPGPKYLVHRIYLSNEQVILDLQSGGVDWSGIFIPNVWEFASYGVRTYYPSPPYFRPNQILVLFVNNRLDYLRDPVLRKAMAYAIDYNEIMQKAFYGYTTQASMSFVFESLPQYRVYINETLARRYWGTPDAKVITNSTYAKQLLEQAGYKDVNGDGFRELPNGQPLNITIMVPSGWTDWMLAADLIAGDLKDIGINAQSYPVDYGAYWGYLTGGAYVTLLGWTPAPTFTHPWDTYRFLLDPRITPPTGNWGWYNKTGSAEREELVGLIEDSSRAFSFEERMKYFSKIQEIIYNDIPSIPIAYTVQWYAYSTKYWEGWPSQGNPWWTEVAPYKEYSLSLWGLFGIRQKGVNATQPSWAKPVDQGGILIPNSKLLEMLANVTGQRFETPVPATTTTTTPATSTTTTQAPTGAGVSSQLLILVVIVVVTMLVILGVRFAVRGRR